MKILVLLIVLAPSLILSAQTLEERVDAALPSLVETYRTLHAAPELSTQEAKTSAFVASRLRSLGYEVTERIGLYSEPDLTCYGVVAVLKNGAGPVVLVRSDMDALPVREQTGLPFSSRVRARNATGDEVDVMHACGHDLHMTTLIGTARMLAELRAQWHGTVVLIGQPAEEVVKGADAMLRDHLYDRFPRPGYVIALHDWSTLEAGRVGVRAGYMMANGDSVNITIRGVGGHGAVPDKTRDPVVVAAQVVIALQTIVSREDSPLDPVVITVGSIHGGTKRNIIPDEVKLLLTVRTYKPEVRRRVLASIARIAKGTAAAAGIPEELAPIVEVLEKESVASTYNDPPLTNRLAATLKRVLGEANVVEIEPSMVSEDFGRFGLDRQIPICMLALGAVDPAKIASGAPLPSLHSSQFAPMAEPAIRTGVKTMTSAVMELLK